MSGAYMEPVSADIADKVWKRMASLSPRRVPKLIQHMTKEQPVVLAYLLAVDDDILNDDERQLLLYLGVVVWQIMSQGARPSPNVTDECLDAADTRNVKIAEYHPRGNRGRLLRRNKNTHRQCQQ